MNEHFLVYETETGRITRTGMCPPQMAALQNGDGEEVMLLAQAIQDDSRYYIEQDQIKLKPTSPSVHHLFDYGTKSWIDSRTVEDIKANQWAKIKAARAAAEFGVFAWSGSTFDADTSSQSRIQGAAQLATLAIMNNQPFSIDWTLADNSVLTLSAEDMIAVGQAMGEHINAQHTKARLKREQINNAATVAEIEAITW